MLGFARAWWAYSIIIFLFVTFLFSSVIAQSKYLLQGLLYQLLFDFY